MKVKTVMSRAPDLVMGIPGEEYPGSTVEEIPRGESLYEVPTGLVPVYPVSLTQRKRDRGRETRGMRFVLISALRIFQMYDWSQLYGLRRSVPSGNPLITIKHSLDNHP